MKSALLNAEYLDKEMNRKIKFTKEVITESVVSSVLLIYTDPVHLVYSRRKLRSLNTLNNPRIQLKCITDAAQKLIAAAY